jgi:hypothetical protein
MAVIDGTRDPKYKYNYVVDGTKLFFSSYIKYDTLGPPGTLNVSTLKTYLIYEKPGPLGIGKNFVTAAVLEPDGKWRPLKENESQYVDLQTSELTGILDQNSNSYVLGDPTIRSLVDPSLNSLNTAARQNAAYTLEKGARLPRSQVNQAYYISQSTSSSGTQIPPVLSSTPDPVLGSGNIPTEPAAAPADPTSPTLQPLLTDEEFAGQFSKTVDIKYKNVLRYPINQSKEETYDYLKIDVLKYVKSGLITSGSERLDLARPSERLPSERLKDILGTVILPMQPNISDSNGVSWNEDPLNAIQGAFASNAYTSIAGAGNIGSAQDAIRAVTNLLDSLGKTVGTLANSKGMSELIAGYFAGQAVGANVIGRATGAVINNNLELLFAGPKLRTFRYSYRFTPREKAEAVMIRKIIRLFKREMATSRSDTGLFLQTPNVFQLKYIYNGDKSGTKGKEHPYLNLIKPCALTNFNVNYTPDGTYMTYAEGGSMTSYTIDMEFSELEPIYKEDYPTSEENIPNMGY